MRKRYTYQFKGQVVQEILKRAVGAVWESRSDCRCLFVMPTEGDFSTIAQKISPRS